MLPTGNTFGNANNCGSTAITMCHNEYGLKRKPITTRNPQSNAIIERIHQTIGNIIRTFDVSKIANRLRDSLDRLIIFMKCNENNNI